MSTNLMKSFKPGAAVALFLSTSAFAVSFAVWGLIGALAPTFAQTYQTLGKREEFDDRDSGAAGRTGKNSGWHVG